MNKNIFYNIALSVAALSMMGCADGDLATDHNSYSYTDSLQNLQYLNEYDCLKTYVDRSVNPDFKLAVGVGAQNYVDGKIECQLANSNFDEMTAGNAMKYASCVKDDGTMDFNLVKEFVEAATANNMTVFGHTLAWHSQQNNNYLNGLLADKLAPGGVSTLHYLTIANGNKDGWWSAQLYYNIEMAGGQNYTFSMDARTTAPYTLHVWTAPGDKEVGTFDIGEDWKTFTVTFSTDADATAMVLALGDMAGSMDIKNVSLVNNATSRELIENGDFKNEDISGWTKPYGWHSFTYVRGSEQQAGGTIPLTDQEKKDTLIWAMDQWIDGMMEACDGKVVAWDVVNEPISGTDADGDGFYDLQSATRNTVDETSQKNNFYWQDYMGDLDYVRTTVASARKHFAEHNGDPSKLKLFVNDYNLESTWDDNKKLKSLIQWISRWEADGVTKIDGIASQMHVSYCPISDVLQKQKEHIVSMLKLMAATGKLVKISELDMGYNPTGAFDDPGLKTEELTDAQQKEMADFYQFIVEKYFEIVPAAQRYGITQWCITDASENSGWRTGEPVGLWTLGYDRKRAYGGFVEGLKKSNVVGNPTSVGDN